MATMPPANSDISQASTAGSPNGRAVAGVKSILIFRIGSLGDTLMTLPALWAVREQFPAARITLLCDQHVGKSYVLAPDVLAGCGAIDDFITYPVGGRKMARLLKLASLVLELRRRHYDLLVYLAPTQRGPHQVGRDRRFFRAAGIRRTAGMGHFPQYPTKTPGVPLAQTLPEADLLLSRLAPDGIRIPAPGEGKLDLSLGEPEEREVARWLTGLPADGGRIWVGVGPGAKTRVNLWPAERYQKVVAGLIERFDVWPVVFGGPEDKDVGDRLVAAWGRGVNASGALGLRASVAALRRCRLFLGNNTGTMHMAVVAGAPCVATTSSREPPGLWYPYGKGHRVFRTPIECEGCYLKECIERGMECTMRIDADEVLAACCDVLAERMAGLDGKRVE
ncbi:MAG: heptosyltransferase family protein [Phycisphaerales bacterium]|jgi:heptosyltransferase-3|nr:heptosyltransferase family protein [Phycisphaerales bacterium]